VVNFLVFRPNRAPLALNGKVTMEKNSRLNFSVS